MSCDKRRLDQFLFYVFFKAGIDDFTDAESFFVRHVDSICHFTRFVEVFDTGKILSGIFSYGLDHSHSIPGRSQIYLLAFVSDLHRAEHFLCSL